MKDHELYSELLNELGLGHAIYEPDSKGLGDGAFDKVRVADVGFIDRCGAFIRLFNVCKDLDHEINKKKPAGFYPLGENFRKINRYTDIGNGPKTSSSISQIGGFLKINTPLGCVLSLFPGTLLT